MNEPHRFLPAVLALLAAAQFACQKAASAREEFIVALEMGNEVADPTVADWRLGQPVAVGAQWVRVYIPWALVEQQKGVMTWNGTAPAYLPPGAFDLDCEMTGIRSRGLRAIAIVQYTPTWARTGGDIYTPPADPEAYGTFVREVVKRYGDVVRIVEVWNEADNDDSAAPPPNAPPGWTPFWHGTVAQYVGILNAAYDAVKATDSSVVVLSSGLSPLTPPLLARWLDAFFANNPKPKFDWFGWHPYGMVPGTGPDANDGTTNSFRGFELVAARLDSEGYSGTPILLSEFGYRYDASVAEDTIASLLPEAFAVARSSPRIKGLSWFSVKYHGGDGDFGLYSDFGQQRLSFAAFRTFASLTAGYRFDRREAGSDNGAAPQVYRFANAAGKRLWMYYAPFVPPLFSVLEPQAMRIHLSAGAMVTQVDRNGAQLEAIADGAGNVNASATSSPAYLVEP